MRGTSGTPRHTKRSRYRCSLPGLAGFAGLRRTEPEVPRIGSRGIRKRLQTQSSTAARAKKENRKAYEKNPLKKRSAFYFAPIGFAGCGENSLLLSFRAERGISPGFACLQRKRDSSLRSE